MARIMRTLFTMYTGDDKFTERQELVKQRAQLRFSQPTNTPSSPINPFDGLSGEEVHIQLLYLLTYCLMYGGESILNLTREEDPKRTLESPVVLVAEEILEKTGLQFFITQNKLHLSQSMKRLCKMSVEEKLLDYPKVGPRTDDHLNTTLEKKKKKKKRGKRKRDEFDEEKRRRKRNRHHHSSPMPDNLQLGQIVGSSSELWK